MTRSYSLFVHYHLKEEERKLIQNHGATVDEIRDNPGKRIAKDLNYLNKLLKTNNSWQGKAFIFFDAGWSELVRRRLSPEESLTIGENIGHLKHYLKNEGLLKYIKPISISDLALFTDKLKKTGLGHYLTGPKGILYYDAPKIVEAIIRIANIGRNVPLFRFDDDVLFSGARNKKTYNIRLFRENLLTLCLHYDKLLKDSSVNYFAFSGSYVDQISEKKFYKPFRKNKVKQSAIINDFATRLLLLTPYPMGKREQIAEGIDYMKAKEFLDQLYTIGANPFVQVISGAGFCLSDGAILDLPPFSDMRQNVVWIDDHLKYALHHELGHFGYNHGTKQVGRIRKVWFPQYRYTDSPITEDVEKELVQYLPRLIYGCIADSWLRSTPELKTRLTKGKFKKAMKGVPGVFGIAFKQYVVKGISKNKDRNALGKKLWKSAEERMDKVIDLFSKFKGTYLEAILEGKDLNDPYPNVIQGGLREASKGIDWKKIPNFSKVKTLPKDPSLHDSITALIVDFIDYIEFARNWMEVVFASRLLLNSSDHGEKFR